MACLPKQRVDTFWVVLSGSALLLPLRVALPDDREAMALFSGEEVTRMFCSLREEREAASDLRETSVVEVLSLLYCLTAAKHVALDTLPKVLRSRLLGLIMPERERFARSFAGVGTVRGPPACSQQERYPQASRRCALADRATLRAC
jgi:hypothetical protein